MKLRPSKSFIFRGTFNYLVAYDHAAGRINRYSIVIPTSNDPVTIGRELSYSDVRKLIIRFETVNSGIVWFGDRRGALRALKRTHGMVL